MGDDHTTPEDEFSSELIFKTLEGDDVSIVEGDLVAIRRDTYFGFHIIRKGVPFVFLGCKLFSLSNLYPASQTVDSTSSQISISHYYTNPTRVTSSSKIPAISTTKYETITYVPTAAVASTFTTSQIVISPNSPVMTTSLLNNTSFTTDDSSDYLLIRAMLLDDANIVVGALSKQQISDLVLKL